MSTARTSWARIAIVGPTHPYKGGVAQHTTELAHRLAERGHSVRIESWSRQYPARLYPGRQRVSHPETEPFAATAYPLSWCRPDSWVRLGRRLYHSADAVIIVVVTPIQAPAYLGILAGLRPAGTMIAGLRPATGPRAAGPAVLALCHNVLPHERRAGDEPLIRAVLRRVSGVVVHTSAEAEQARALTDRPVAVAVMAPHLRTWREMDTADGDIRPSTDGDGAGDRAGDRAGDGDRVRRRLLFFGLIRPYKGLDILLRALAAGPPDVCLTVAGEFWGGVERTRELVAELGLTARVELRPGYVSVTDVPALFATADALVLPYRAGTATQNVDLAHLHGLPVVATRVGGLAETVRDGVDGLLAAPGDSVSLAGTLRRLYEPGVLKALRARVVPPDADAAWARYLDVVMGATGAR
ncbi:glycosyltransferase [Frankia sp. Cr1]|uniref:glycosyltransferase family 4 protein n=1 Tax=Frankia sp. Cr1 TaxID=3073931 RepID=UPI002AD2BC6D|nr:glycosyltransferase [Frankia sp. Cr1]